MKSRPTFQRAPPRTARLSGAAYLAVSQTIVVALGYVTHVLVGKIGGPPLYGVYGVVLSIMTIINLPLTFGIPIATSKEVAEDPENSGGVFRTAARLQLLFALALAGVTIAVAPLVAFLLGDATLVPLIRFAALIAPAQATYALLANYFNGLHAFATQARLVTLYAVFKLAGSIGFLVWFRSVIGALSGFIVGGILATAVGLPRALPTIRDRSVRPVPARRLFVFAGSFLGMSVALQLLMSIDLFLVKRLLASDTLAGYYTAATTIARIPYFILQGLGAVFLPSVAQLLTHNLQDAREFMRKVFRYVYLALLPIAVFSATTSKALLSLFFTAAYHPAAPALTILSLGFGFLSAFYLLATIAAGAGRPRSALLVASGTIPLSVLLGTFLIPRQGITGAALTTLTSAIVAASVMALILGRSVELSFPLLTAVRGAFATAIAVIPTYVVTPPTSFLPLWYILLLAAYLAALIALGELGREDRRYARQLLPGRRAATPPDS